MPDRARPIPGSTRCYEEAIRDTIEQFEATGSPVITDGEQRKYHNFWTYSRPWAAQHGAGRFQIPFSAGHVRRMPRLTGAPFRYQRRADEYLETALRYATRSREASGDLAVGLEPDVSRPRRSTAIRVRSSSRICCGSTRRRFATACSKGAHKVQIDFTEGRLAVKIDPSGHLLHSFIDLNNLALARFSAEDRQRIGIHTCPGGDRDSTHSADVDYAELLPGLFELNAGNFYVALAGEPDRVRVLKIIRAHLKPHQRVFVGVIAPIDPRIETPEEVRDRVLEAAEFIPMEQLGTTDDCGFAPVQRRHVDQSRHRIREDTGPGAGNGARRRPCWEAAGDRRENEEQLLRSVALQNAKAILQARQQAEQALVQANQALELKSAELAQSLAMLRATLESTTDGILVTDGAGNLTGFNERFVSMWRFPPRR